MLSAAKHLAADGDRPFASLRVTRCDGSNCQVQFVQIEPCLIYFIPCWLEGDHFLEVVQGFNVLLQTSFVQFFFQCP